MPPMFILSQLQTYRTPLPYILIFKCIASENIKETLLLYVLYLRMYKITQPLNVKETLLLYLTLNVLDYSTFERKGNSVTLPSLKCIRLLNLKT